MCWPSVAAPSPAGAASCSSPASSCFPLTSGGATSTAQPLAWRAPCTTCSSCRTLKEAAHPMWTGKPGSSESVVSPGRRCVSSCSVDVLSDHVQIVSVHTLGHQVGCALSWYVSIQSSMPGQVQRAWLTQIDSHCPRVGLDLWCSHHYLTLVIKLYTVYLL